MKLPAWGNAFARQENAPAETPSLFYRRDYRGAHRIRARRLIKRQRTFRRWTKASPISPEKNVNALIMDLRASPATTDLPLAAEFAKRFCPKGKRFLLCANRWDIRTACLVSDRDPAFRGSGHGTHQMAIRLVAAEVRSLRHCDFTTRPCSSGRRPRVAQMNYSICR